MHFAKRILIACGGALLLAGLSGCGGGGGIVSSILTKTFAVNEKNTSAVGVQISGTYDSNGFVPVAAGASVASTWDIHYSKTAALQQALVIVQDMAGTELARSVCTLNYNTAKANNTLDVTWDGATITFHAKP